GPAAPVLRLAVLGVRGEPRRHHPRHRADTAGGGLRLRRPQTRQPCRAGLGVLGERLSGEERLPDMPLLAAYLFLLAYAHERGGRGDLVPQLRRERLLHNRLSEFVAEPRMMPGSQGVSKIGQRGGTQLRAVDAQYLFQPEADVAVVAVLNAHGVGTFQATVHL